AAQFARGEDIADPAVLTEALQACGVDPAPWHDLAQQEETKASLRGLTDRARAHGVFGAPSFLVGDELFWGDDRLEEAIALASTARGF
ncbi:MAG: 2-hydroxychromene-2-carboxylate isomerase, partial [Sulfitobacter sp.]|nr:2-hydroxychromene-2-carboxylate isomerase [Sulfitobacter sp.]